MKKDRVHFLLAVWFFFSALCLILSAAHSSSLATAAQTQIASGQIDPTRLGGNHNAPRAQASNVTLTKSGPPVANAGQVITFTIEYANSGPQAATNVVITDTVPVSTKYENGTLAIDTGSGYKPLPDPVSSQVIVVAPGITPGEIADGESGRIRFSVRIDEDLTPGEQIANTATLTRDNAQPLNTDVLLIPIADLTLSKAVDPGIAGPGTRLTYQITLGSTGTVPQNEVTVQDAIPAHTRYVGGSAVVPPGFTLFYSTNGGASWTTTPPAAASVTHLRWTRPTIDEAFSQTMGYQVQVENPFSQENVVITNQAQVWSAQTPVIYSNRVNVQTVDPFFSKSQSSSTARAKQRITYTIRFGNNGSADIANAVITDAIPANTTLVPGSITGGGTIDGNVVTWSVSIPAQSSSSVSFVVQVTDVFPTGVEAITNTATIAAYGYTVSKTVVASVIADPVFYMYKSDGQTYVWPGQLMTYRIYVSNVGTQDAADVVVSDRLPSQVRYVPGSLSPADKCTMAGSQLTCSVPSMPVGDDLSISFVVAVVRPLADGTVIVNTASVVDSQVTTPVKDTVTCTVYSPSLSVEKRAEATVVGRPITYTITVQNASTRMAATDVVVTDTLPNGVTYIDGGELVSGQVHWTIPLIPETESRTVTFTVDPGCLNTVINADYRVVTSTQGAESSVGTSVVSVLASPTISPQISYEPMPAFVNRSVTFTETGTTNGSPVVAWEWDLGDGKTASGQSVTHIYTSPGTFTVTLVVTDACGYRSEPVARSLIVSNLAIDKRAAADVFVDQQLDYVIVVTNNSSIAVTSVVVSDTIPANMTIVPGSISPADDCTFYAASSRLVCNRSTLASRQSMTINYAVEFNQQFVAAMAPASAIAVANTAAVHCVQAPVPAKDTAKSMVRLHVQCLPLLAKAYEPPVCGYGFEGWGTGTYPEATYQYDSSSDEYRIRAQQFEMARSTAPFGSYNEYDVKVQALWARPPVNGDVYGLLFGIQDQDSWRVNSVRSLYAFFIDTAGTRAYTLMRFSANSGWSDVVAWKIANDQIGPDIAANELKVSCYGGRATLYVNDHALWSGALPSSCLGDVGVTSWLATSANLEARFATFRVCGKPSDAGTALGAQARNVNVPEPPRLLPPQ